MTSTVSLRLGLASVDLDDLDVIAKVSTIGRRSFLAATLDQSYDLLLSDKVGDPRPGAQQCAGTN